MEGCVCVYVCVGGGTRGTRGREEGLTEPFTTAIGVAEVIVAVFVDLFEPVEPFGVIRVAERKHARVQCFAVRPPRDAGTCNGSRAQ